MTIRILAGVSALALALAASSGAMANPKNSFSDGNVQTVISSASASTGLGGGNATANSESFNVSQEAVSIQTLAQTNNGVHIEAAPVLGDNTRNQGAVIGGNAQQFAAGVNQQVAQTGNQSMAQTASNVNAIGTVSIQ